MKLSEAIRFGAMLKPQAFVAIEEDGGTCAIGAALDAIGQLDNKHGFIFTGDEPAGWEWINVMDVVCPVCRQNQDAQSAILCLNDGHAWTRERIADWVATVEPSAPGFTERSGESETVDAGSACSGAPVLTLRAKASV